MCAPFLFIESIYLRSDYGAFNYLRGSNIVQVAAVYVCIVMKNDFERIER